VAQVIQDAKLPVDVEEYIQSFKPHMMEIVYMWSKVRAATATYVTAASGCLCLAGTTNHYIVQGSKFSEICKMTDVFEGMSPLPHATSAICTDDILPGQARLSGV